MKEDEIAALDGDWAEFTPAERAAFAFCRKLTLEPHRLADDDIDQLRKHYKDLQILEMILSMAGNNSINRWKEGAGIPQSPTGGGLGGRTETPAGKHTYLTPTSDPFKNKITQVAPLLLDDKTGQPTRRCVFRGPPLGSREEVERALAACRRRAPSLPLVEEARAREVLPEDWPHGPLPQWVRLLANFPGGAKGRIAGIRSAEEKGDLSPLLKAQVSWIVARQDRAWYAVGLAQQRLTELGCSDDQIDKLDGDWKDFSASERALFTVARQLTASPIVHTDGEVAEAVRLVGPRDVVQLINYSAGRASFDRMTEAAGLQLEK
ncbi:MAG TPA: hypothetical protein VKD72_09040 [Gemmataceae bacterium]|nr:hypothetical protein [Gemmataceae bacterium]